jgi:hypothetical protein
MSTFDDPNREAVGLPPIWTGADAEPKSRTVEAEPEEPAPPPKSRSTK